MIDFTTDLWLILIALANTLLLLLLHRTLHVKAETVRRFLTFRFADSLDFFDHLVKDILVSLIIAHLMIYLGAGKTCTLIAVIALHIIADIPVTAYYCKNSSRHK